MGIKKENKIIQVVLTSFHQRKLAILEARTGLSKTGIIQRLLEKADIYESVDEEE